MSTYGDADGVSGLVPTWDGSTNPTLEQVQAWEEEAYAEINLALANAGYSQPVDDSAAIYPRLRGLENLYAAAYLLRALAIDTASGEGEERSEVWLADFYARLGVLTASNLALLGVTVAVTTTANTGRRRIRTLQMRRVDGYSDPYMGDGGVVPAEYTVPTTPTE